jgi:SAM-dependent methyltransferase
VSRNLYDDPAFLAGYSTLPRSVQGLEGAPEWPAIRAMLPAIEGRRIVDLGCGFGWFCRWAAEQGAAEVLGLDRSSAMLDRARAFGAQPGITYREADLEQLSLPEARFDFAFSALALHYLADAGRFFAAVHRALAPGGWLVFSTEHPIFMAPRQPGWAVDAEGRKTWPLDQYLVEGQRVTDWFVEGVVKYHRLMATTLNLLIGAGFTIRHVEEFCPSDAQIAAQPELAEERERPMFLMVSATRAATVG